MTRPSLPFGCTALSRGCSTVGDIHEAAGEIVDHMEQALNGMCTMQDVAFRAGVSTEWLNRLLKSCDIHVPHGGRSASSRLTVKERERAVERLDAWFRAWLAVREDQMPTRWRVRKLTGKGVNHPMSSHKPKPKKGMKGKPGCK